jgi:hypothetical protein
MNAIAKAIRDQLDDEWPEVVGRIRGIIGTTDDDRKKIQKIESLLADHERYRASLWKELLETIEG